MRRKLACFQFSVTIKIQKKIYKFLHVPSHERTDDSRIYRMKNDNFPYTSPRTFYLLCAAGEKTNKHKTRPVSHGSESVTTILRSQMNFSLSQFSPFQLCADDSGARKNVKQKKK